jgi:hypothetical protein
MSGTKEVGKRQRPVVVTLVHTADGETRRTRIVIDVILKVGKEERRVKALVDSGAEANYMKRRLAMEMNIPAIKGETTPLVSPKGRKIYSYADHILTVTAEDT